MMLFLPPFSSATTPSSTLSPQVLRDWLQAITAFHLSYYQLNQYKLSSELGGSPIKPYLSGQVNQVLEQMSQELGALLHELTSSPDSVSLASHTARLRLLTNQALMVIGLLTPSSS